MHLSWYVFLVKACFKVVVRSVKIPEPIVFLVDPVLPYLMILRTLVQSNEFASVWTYYRLGDCQSLNQKYYNYLHMCTYQA